ncbi:hypothetical protein EON79_14390 [bacterium]|nr:MAG: hypothetical protein EON79_14390 [bacterium]
MSDRRALIVFGGWDGHDPVGVADFFAGLLRGEGFETELSDTLDAFLDADKIAGLSLIVPVWTMGEITGEQCASVTTAVAEHGVGIAGCHGGMCDSFRTNTEWQFMTGSQWVAHPGNDGLAYRIDIADSEHPITRGLSDFDVASEQYYLHVDPGVKVLATTDFPTPGADGPHSGNPCKMPQVYTKMFGAGRVFYNALGHQRNVLEAAEPKELMRRGFLWAAKGVGLE